MPAKPEFRISLEVFDFETLKEVINRDQEHHLALFRRAQEQAQIASTDEKEKIIAENARRALNQLHAANLRRERLKRALGLTEE